MTRTDFAIAGAGIGGLTAALALARLGRRVLVVEREGGPHELGNGLQLAPNAMRILAHLGLAAPLPVYGRPEALELRDAADGRRLARVPLGRSIERRHGAPYCTVARGELHRNLLGAAADAGVEIRHGAALEEARAGADGADLRLAGGARVAAHGLIGADGLWSRTRALVAPSARPRHVGHVAWRATAPLPQASGEARIVVWLGRRIHAVLYPIEAGTRLNLVVVTEGRWTGEGWHETAEAAELADLATGLAAPLAAAIGSAATWRRWPLFVTRPAVSPGAGPITLLGDAAHPLLPYLAQGAGMAIEDAFALAAAVAGAPDDATAAFRAYERSRAGRLAQVAAASARSGWIFHLGGAMRMARDLVLGAAPAGLLLARYDWLWGGGPLPAAALR